MKPLFCLIYVTAASWTAVGGFIYFIEKISGYEYWGVSGSSVIISLLIHIKCQWLVTRKEE